MNKQKKSKKRALLIIACLTVLSIVSIGVDSNCLWAQETKNFVADTARAVVQSSGWVKKDFTLTVLSGSGKFRITINPPFPHPVSGIGDSYVQTATGVGLMHLDQAAKEATMQLRAGNYAGIPKTLSEKAMSWLLKAALQDEMDAIMILAVAYASSPDFKNPAESERWFRKAMELGNSDAEAYLNDFLAGKRVDSMKMKNGYIISIKRL